MHSFQPQAPQELCFYNRMCLCMFLVTQNEDDLPSESQNDAHKKIRVAILDFGKKTGKKHPLIVFCVSKFLPVPKQLKEAIIKCLF